MGLGLPVAAYQRGCATPYRRTPDPDDYIPPDDEDNELAQQRAEHRHKSAQEEFMIINLIERTCLNMIKSALAAAILLPKTECLRLLYRSPSILQRVR